MHNFDFGYHLVVKFPSKPANTNKKAIFEKQNFYLAKFYPRLFDSKDITSYSENGWIIRHGLTLKLEGSLQFWLVWYV